MTNRHLQTEVDLPDLRLVLQTIAAFAAGIIAVLAGVRYAVEGRRLDLLLSHRISSSPRVSTTAFSIVPALNGHPIHRPEAWAGVVGRLFSWVLDRDRAVRARALRPAGAREHDRRRADRALPRLARPPFVPARACRPSIRHAETPGLLTGSLAALALLNLLALVGFGKRFYERREDLDRWLALGATLMLFASLHYIFTPALATNSVSRGDFLRLLAYGLLLVGAWRAISFAVFGRAVAEERARVAREIHDGLAQYLFAVSTHATMLEQGAPPQETIAQAEGSGDAAQQEARFAILALSTAAGQRAVRRGAPPLRRLPHG